MAAGNRTDTRISIRHGTNNGAQWHNVALEGDEGAAQVLDCTGLNGGPCRDRTYDQLIKRSFLSRALLPSKTSTYASPVVPRFVDLRIDKALSVLLGGFSNGTVVYRYELSLSNF
jgi:hypothetical protein